MVEFNFAHMSILQAKSNAFTVDAPLVAIYCPDQSWRGIDVYSQFPRPLSEEMRAHFGQMTEEQMTISPAFQLYKELTDHKSLDMDRAYLHVFVLFLSSLGDKHRTENMVQRLTSFRDTVVSAVPLEWQIVLVDNVTGAPKSKSGFPNLFQTSDFVPKLVNELRTKFANIRTSVTKGDVESVRGIADLICHGVCQRFWTLKEKFAADIKEYDKKLLRDKKPTTHITPFWRLCEQRFLNFLRFNEYNMAEGVISTAVVRGYQVIVEGAAGPIPTNLPRPQWPDWADPLRFADGRINDVLGRLDFDSLGKPESVGKPIITDRATDAMPKTPVLINLIRLVGLQILMCLLLADRTSAIKFFSTACVKIYQLLEKQKISRLENLAVRYRLCQLMLATLQATRPIRRPTQFDRFGKYLQLTPPVTPVLGPANAPEFGTISSLEPGLHSRTGSLSLPAAAAGAAGAGSSMKNEKSLENILIDTNNLIEQFACRDTAEFFLIQRKSFIDLAKGCGYALPDFAVLPMTATTATTAALPPLTLNRSDSEVAADKDTISQIKSLIPQLRDAQAVVQFIVEMTENASKHYGMANQWRYQIVLSYELALVLRDHDAERAALLLEKHVIKNIRLGDWPGLSLQAHQLLLRCQSIQRAAVLKLDDSRQKRQALLNINAKVFASLVEVIGVTHSHKQKTDLWELIHRFHVLSADLYEEKAPIGEFLYALDPSNDIIVDSTSSVGLYWPKVFTVPQFNIRVPRDSDMATPLKSGGPSGETPTGGMDASEIQSPQVPTLAPVPVLHERQAVEITASFFSAVPLDLDTIVVAKLMSRLDWQDDADESFNPTMQSTATSPQAPRKKSESPDHEQGQDANLTDDPSGSGSDMAGHSVTLSTSNLSVVAVSARERDAGLHFSAQVTTGWLVQATFAFAVCHPGRYRVCQFSLTHRDGAVCASHDYERTAALQMQLVGSGSNVVSMESSQEAMRLIRTASHIDHWEMFKRAIRSRSWRSIFRVPDPSKWTVAVEVAAEQEIHFFADPQVPPPRVTCVVRRTDACLLDREAHEWVRLHQSTYVCSYEEAQSETSFSATRRTLLGADDTPSLAMTMTLNASRTVRIIEPTPEEKQSSHVSYAPSPAEYFHASPDARYPTIAITGGDGGGPRGGLHPDADIAPAIGHIIVTSERLPERRAQELLARVSDGRKLRGLSRTNSRHSSMATSPKRAYIGRESVGTSTTSRGDGSPGGAAGRLAGGGFFSMDDAPTVVSSEEDDGDSNPPDDRQDTTVLPEHKNDTQRHDPDYEDPEDQGPQQRTETAILPSNMFPDRQQAGQQPSPQSSVVSPQKNGHHPDEPALLDNIEAATHHHDGDFFTHTPKLAVRHLKGPSVASSAFSGDDAGSVAYSGPIMVPSGTDGCVVLLDPPQDTGPDVGSQAVAGHHAEEVRAFKRTRHLTSEEQQHVLRGDSAAAKATNDVGRSVSQDSVEDATPLTVEWRRLADAVHSRRRRRPLEGCTLLTLRDEDSTVTPTRREGTYGTATAVEVPIPLSAALFAVNTPPPGSSAAYDDGTDSLVGGDAASPRDCSSHTVRFYYGSRSAAHGFRHGQARVNISMAPAFSVRFAFKALKEKVWCFVTVQNELRTVPLFIDGASVHLRLLPPISHQLEPQKHCQNAAACETPLKPRDVITFSFVAMESDDFAQLSQSANSTLQQRVQLEFNYCHAAYCEPRNRIIYNRFRSMGTSFAGTHARPFAARLYVLHPIIDYDKRHRLHSEFSRQRQYAAVPWAVDMHSHSRAWSPTDERFSSPFYLQVQHSEAWLLNGYLTKQIRINGPNESLDRCHTFLLYPTAQGQLAAPNIRLFQIDPTTGNEVNIPCDITKEFNDIQVQEPTAGGGSGLLR
jgi:hypothetical protein